MKRVLPLVLLALTSMTGCSGDFATAVLGHQNSVCAPPQGVDTVLAYPAPGATGIPDNVGQIIFASTSLLPGNYRAYLIDETADEQYQVNFNTVSSVTVNPPLPQPLATPPFSNPEYQASVNPGVTFPQGHLISVHLEQVKCNTSASYGNFNVQ